MGVNERAVQDSLQRNSKRISRLPRHGVHHISGMPAHRSRANVHETITFTASIPQDLFQFDEKLLRTW
jgi:hypothetical protein